ncbi:MAG: RnfABCDGE type electron transport complex subunit G [Sarcina sp.]
MKENLKLGGILLSITLSAGVLLGVTHGLTKEAIIENSKINKDDLTMIMPAAKSIEDTDFTLAEDGAIKEAYKAKDGENEVGYVFKVTTKGFHGPVDLFVGIAEDKVTGMKISAHSETPGLGARIEEESFRTKFNDLPIKENIEIVKTAPTKESQIDGISGATVSSKAVGTAINDTIKFYKENVKGEEVEEIQEDATTAASGDW